MLRFAWRSLLVIAVLIVIAVPLYATETIHLNSKGTAYAFRRGTEAGCLVETDPCFQDASWIVTVTDNRWPFGKDIIFATKPNFWGMIGIQFSYFGISQPLASTGGMAAKVYACCGSKYDPNEHGYAFPPVETVVPLTDE